MSEHRGGARFQDDSVVRQQSSSMASCTNCHYKFVTPSTLKGDPTAVEQYLGERFDRHECKNEPEDGKGRHLGSGRWIRLTRWPSEVRLSASSSNDRTRLPVCKSHIGKSIPLSGRVKQHYA
jgi:hypothetical protein